MAKEIRFVKSENGDYVTEKVFKSGMTGRIEISYFFNKSGKRVYWGVFLVIYHKRKQIDTLTLKQTGRDGLEPLVWAKQAVLAFEDFLVERGSNYDLPNYIYIGAEDKRRFRAYQKGLGSSGFRKVFVDGNWVLVKEVQFT